MVKPLWLIRTSQCSQMYTYTNETNSPPESGVSMHMNFCLRNTPLKRFPRHESGEPFRTHSETGVWLVPWSILCQNIGNSTNTTDYTLNSRSTNVLQLCTNKVKGTHLPAINVINPQCNHCWLTAFSARLAICFPTKQKKHTRLTNC